MWIGQPEIEAGAWNCSGMVHAKGVTVQPRECDMVNFIRNFMRDETGAAAAEYALILAIVGAGIAGAAVLLGGSITTAMNDAGDCITNAGVGC